MKGWITVFSNMPETRFFALYRHYIGQFPTPFHKTDLIKRMSDFFDSERIVKQSYDWLDYDDVRVLSSIALHSHPTLESIALIDDAVNAQTLLILQERLTNLEERLFLWRSQQDELIYRLTPLSQKALENGLLGAGVILGKPVPLGEIESPDDRPWFNGNFLNSLLGFLMETDSLYRREGGLRSKSLELLEKRFPILFHDEKGEDRFNLAIKTLMALGLIKQREDDIEIILPAWRKLENIEQEYMDLLITASAMIGGQFPNDLAMGLIKTLLHNFPVGKFYQSANIKKLFCLIGLKDKNSVQVILNNLALLGIFAEREPESLGRIQLLKMSNTPPVTITPVGDIVCQPGYPLDCDLALLAQPVTCDTVSTFHIKKECCMTGLNAGINPEKFFKKLEKKSGNSLPTNINTLITEWITEYRSIGLQIAVVLHLQEPLAGIIEKSHVLDEFAFANPAPGIWLLNPADEDIWRKALEKAGLTHLPQLKQKVKNDHWELQEVNLPPQWSVNTHKNLLSIGWNWPELPAQTPRLTRMLQMHDDYIHPVFPQLNESEKVVFMERFNRRIILSPEQIRPGIWSTEKGIARGLDHQVKINLAEAAILGTNERLEISFTTGGILKTLITIPQNLEKVGTDYILSGISVPDCKPVRQPIRKIVLLRRFKAFLI